MPYNSPKKFKYVVQAFSLLSSSFEISEDEKMKELNKIIDKIPLNRKIQSSGSTLLNSSIHNEYYKISEILLDNGADVSLKNDSHHFKPIIHNLNKLNIPLTSLLLKHSETPIDDLFEIINHSFKHRYSKMCIYAINKLYLLKKKDIKYILNINFEPKLNTPSKIYKQIINYPVLCLEFNASFYKYYPKDTKDKIVFIIRLFTKTNIVLPLELVFLILKKIILVML